MPRSLSLLLVIIAVVSAGFTGVATATTFADNGALGLGDPYFPQAGNVGYDVSHYGLFMDYSPPPSNFMTGKAVITAAATRVLDSFSLDLRAYTVSGVKVDGRRARFSRSGQKLIVTPATRLWAGRNFVVSVEYSGSPETVIDPDGTTEGWVPTTDGAFVVGEPQGSPGWFPVNDSPRDKATYSFTITVPNGITAMANGRLVDRSSSKGKTTWRWYEDSPMASYLATSTLGAFDLRLDRTDEGLPLYNAVARSFTPDEKAAAWTVLARQEAIIKFFSRYFGDYPFSSGGGVVDMGGVGYSLESQTRANYDGVPDEATVVHEIVHSWFGNSVTLTVWPDIWLAEGFAGWGEWFWAEENGGETAQARFDREYAEQPDEFWTDRAPANVGGPEYLFSEQPYTRGAMTLQALRAKVGDRTFLRILRRWAAENRYSNVTTADFVSLAERISGTPLADFFNAWLYVSAKPAL